MAITINAHLAIDRRLIAPDDADSLASLTVSALETSRGAIIISLSKTTDVATIFANTFWNSVARRASVDVFPRIRVFSDYANDAHVALFETARENVEAVIRDPAHGAIIDVAAHRGATADEADENCDSECPLMRKLTAVSAEIAAVRAQFIQVEQMLAAVLMLVSVSAKNAASPS